VRVSRQALHAWLGRYEVDGLEGLADRSHRPGSCPYLMSPLVEVAVLELRRVHPAWGPRRLVVELGRRGVAPLPSESGVYRALTRAGLIEPGARRRRRESWKRWELNSLSGFKAAPPATVDVLRSSAVIQVTTLSMRERAGHSDKRSWRLRSARAASMAPTRLSWPAIPYDLVRGDLRPSRYAAATSSGVVPRVRSGDENDRSRSRSRSRSRAPAGAGGKARTGALQPAQRP
jgi:hypothetical protein